MSTPIGSKWAVTASTAEVPTSALSKEDVFAWSLLSVIGFIVALKLTNGFHPVMSDFAQLYVAGAAFRHGVMPYGSYLPMNGMPEYAEGVLTVYYYPPVVGAIFAVPSLLPYVLADVIWIVAIVLVLGSAVWRMARLVWPQAHVAVPLLITLVTLLGSGARWNLVNHQPSAMIIGLLIHFCLTVAKRKNSPSILLALAISLKPTYLLPVLGIYLYDRDYRKVGMVLLAAIGLSLLAAAPTGFTETLGGYASVTRGLINGSINHATAIDSMSSYLEVHPELALASSPYRSSTASTYIDQMIHADFVASAWAPSAAGTAIVSKLIVLLGLAAAFLAAKTMRNQASEATSEKRFAFVAMLTALSLLIGYHNRYDLLALTPAGFVAVLAIRQNRYSAFGWMGAIAALLACWLLTSRLVSLWVEIMVGKTGLLPLLPICGYLVIGCFVACAIYVGYAPKADRRNLAFPTPEVI
jgi:hypothetical protein